MKIALVGLMLLGCVGTRVITDSDRAQRRQMVACTIVAYESDMLNQRFVCDCAGMASAIPGGGLSIADLAEGVGLDAKECK